VAQLASTEVVCPTSFLKQQHSTLAMLDVENLARMEIIQPGRSSKEMCSSLCASLQGSSPILSCQWTRSQFAVCKGGIHGLKWVTNSSLSAGTMKSRSGDVFKETSQKSKLLRFLPQRARPTFTKRSWVLSHDSSSPVRRPL